MVLAGVVLYNLVVILVWDVCASVLMLPHIFLGPLWRLILTVYSVPAT